MRIYQGIIWGLYGVYGDYMEIIWGIRRLYGVYGDYMEIIWRLHGDYIGITVEVIGCI